MGLDIYLYRCSDRKAAKAAEEAHEAFTESLWNADSRPYEKIPEAIREEIRAKSKENAAALGIKEYSHESVEEIRQDSALYPEHMFKIGYFRSSYNGGGIERVLGNHGIPTLHDIFGYAGEYEFSPDWSKARDLCDDAIMRYAAELEISGGELRVMRVELNMFSDPKSAPQSEEEALTRFKKERERGVSFSDGYSNSEGTFFLKEGLTILGALPGVSTILRKQPCAYLVYRTAGAASDNWYLQALKIVRETIDFVLARPDRETFYLHWSG